MAGEVGEQRNRGTVSVVVVEEESRVRFVKEQEVNVSSGYSASCVDVRSVKSEEAKVLLVALKSVKASEVVCEPMTKRLEESSVEMMFIIVTSSKVNVPWFTMTSDPLVSVEGVSVPNIREAKCAVLSPVCS